MSPQPLSRVKPGASWSTGLHLNKSLACDLPDELWALGTKIISTWSFVEAELLRMAIRYVGADRARIASILHAIRSGSATRAAVEAGALYELDDEDDKKAFRATMKALAHPETIRNRYAHHIWASSEDVPDALLLVDPTTIDRWAAGVTDRIDESKTMVYRRNDMQNDLEEMVEAASLMSGLYSWYFERFVERSQALQGLLNNHPRFRQAYQGLSTSSP